MQPLFHHSPYLTRLSQKYQSLCKNYTADELDLAIKQECFSLPAQFDSQTQVMSCLREAKNKLALLVATGDLSGIWPLEKVTMALSHFASYALTITLNYLLLEAEKRSEIKLKHPENPCLSSGIIVLGMGKLGAYELNYSSDIDLIIFFESGNLSYTGKRTEQHFMNKLAQDMVHIMQERTADGYVFRTDLRLRPDPASTPPAITVVAAMNYYESVGQNWERAAMIKARPVAGDIAAGDAFLKSLAPYMWRRSLDFAAINDIHSIKRQMDARGERVIKAAGHNIKIGLGGIREIEFYVQIHQLIWGGRKNSLRLRGTCETLHQLVLEGLIDASTCDTLLEAYRFHRTIEHRLQMVEDAQTHSLPDDPASMHNVALFSGYATVAQFEEALLSRLHAVHHIYSRSFRSDDELGIGVQELGTQGNLVFTGVTHDPDTLSTLATMGYKNPESISEIIMSWHHGSRRCTRTKRARELLTELMPILLTRLADTANPDAAFLKFDEFLHHLPAAIQLFSLFQANPKLLGLIADIMGSAPALADTLSRMPELIENVLFSDFYKKLPIKADIIEQASERIAYANDLEETVDFLVRFKNEKQFQAGVHFLRGMISAHELGRFLSDIAEVMVEKTLAATQAEFEKTYGTISESQFSVIALGKFGSRELTFHSDLDLVFVYHVPDFETASDGEKSFTASVYYNRFAQRFVSALTALNTAGKLYEVDTRLRPSGKQGLLAVSDQALNHYFDELAWTFEFMAFTKARAVAGDVLLCDKLNAFINALMSRPRDLEKLRNEVIDMRKRMDEEYGTQNVWDIKYVRGGLVDVDFISQYLLLRYAPSVPGAKTGSAREIFEWCVNNFIISADDGTLLLQAEEYLGHVFHMLRLCVGGKLDEQEAQAGLKSLLSQSAQMADFEALKNKLVALELSVSDAYIRLVESSS